MPRRLQIEIVAVEEQQAPEAETRKALLVQDLEIVQLDAFAFTDGSAATAADGNHRRAQFPAHDADVVPAYGFARTLVPGPKVAWYRREPLKTDRPGRKGRAGLTGQRGGGEKRGRNGRYRGD